MESMYWPTLLGLSLLGHAAAFFVFRRKMNAARKVRPLDISAEELMRDLVAGGAIVKIERIDPQSLLMWRSP